MRISLFPSKYGKSKGKEHEETSILPHTALTSAPKSLSNNANGPTDVPPPTSILAPTSIHPRPINRIKSISSIPRMSTDAITMTLAQRLNELAVANSEGLLNDDEYRLLRQNLFERFTSNTSMPTEACIVPLAGQALSMVDGRLPLSSQRNPPPSSFHLNSSRSPSIRSKTSVSSGVTSLLRRATGKFTASRSNNISSNDTASVFSTNSGRSNLFRRSIFPRLISKNGSSSSLQTEALNDDNSSCGSILEGTTHQATPLASPNSVPRYQALRRWGTPSSPFPAHVVGEAHHIMPGTIPIVLEENLKTVKDIRREIWAVEAEGRRLIDGFNGLELSKVTRHPPLSVLPFTQGMGDMNGEDSTWTLTTEGKSPRHGLDSDTISVRSGTSVGTTPSVARSGYSGRRVQIKAGTPLTRPTSLRRKNSMSSVSSQGHNASVAPPVPALPLSLRMLGVEGSSNVSLPKSSGHSTANALREKDGMAPSDSNRGVVGLEPEMSDIRRRRAEVTRRYEARLEYLRAKLRGAELHEKLLRK